MLDLPDDFFRIRLVCTVLDTCGHCFDRGSAKKKLDFFLTFFQYYIYTKEPLPMDIDFLVQDTFSVVRPQWKIAVDLQEAASLFGEAVAQNYQSQGAKPEPEEDDAESSSSDEGLEEDAIPEIDEEESSDEAEVSSLHSFKLNADFRPLVPPPNKTATSSQKTRKFTSLARKRNAIRRRRQSSTVSSRR